LSGQRWFVGLVLCKGGGEAVSGGGETGPTDAGLVDGIFFYYGASGVRVAECERAGRARGPQGRAAQEGQMAGTKGARDRSRDTAAKRVQKPGEPPASGKKLVRTAKGVFVAGSLSAGPHGG